MGAGGVVAGGVLRVGVPRALRWGVELDGRFLPAAGRVFRLGVRASANWRAEAFEGAGRAVLLLRRWVFCCGRRRAGAFLRRFSAAEAMRAAGTGARRIRDNSRGGVLATAPQVLAKKAATVCGVRSCPMPSTMPEVVSNPF